MKKISIAIPTYEMKGYGKKFLEELFISIQKQTYKDIEVVVSDHSENNDILELCSSYSNKFEIIYIKNFYDYGNGPSNTNSSIKYCTGDIIKIMFSDDLFTDDYALEKIQHKFLETNSSWIVNGFSHTTDGKEFYRPMIPRWSEHLLEGQNFMGGPSIVSMKKECIEYFDPECKMLMDTEFYHRMRYNYGMPTVIDDVLVCSREGKHRISSNLHLDIICEHPEGCWEANSKELEYVMKKHKDTREYEK